MCMEDVKIGRNTSTNLTYRGAVSAGLVVAPANPRRVAMVFCYSNGASPLTLERALFMPRRFGAATPIAIAVTNYAGTLKLSIEEFGTAIQDEWTVTDTGIGGDCAVFEQTLEARKPDDLIDM